MDTTLGTISEQSIRDISIHQPETLIIYTGYLDPIIRRVLAEFDRKISDRHEFMHTELRLFSMLVVTLVTLQQVDGISRKLLNNMRNGILLGATISLDQARIKKIEAASAITLRELEFETIDFSRDPMTQPDQVTLSAIRKGIDNLYPAKLAVVT